MTVQFWDPHADPFMNTICGSIDGKKTAKEMRKELFMERIRNGGYWVSTGERRKRKDVLRWRPVSITNEP